MISAFAKTDILAQATPPSEKMEQYLYSAELVIEGKVLDETFAVRNATSGSIETVHTILIDRVLKGNTSFTSIEVHTPGGRLDDVIESVSHGSTLGGGQNGIFLLSSNSAGASLGNATVGYHLHGGNAGKITRLKYDDDYEAIHWGELDKYKSWRQLREQVGASLGVDLTIHALTATELQAMTNDKEFCMKLDNPVPNVEDMTVEFDVMAKSSVPGLKFARAEVIIDYPTGNLGDFIVDQEKIEAGKGDITDGPAYTVAVEDKSEDQIELSIESPCDNSEPHYVLDTVYEKLATLTIEVNEWGDFGTMNVNDFSVAGVAEYVNPATFQGTPGCTEFEDLCGEGEYVMDFCSITSTNLSGSAGIQNVVTINGSKFGTAQQASKLLTPNAETGGLTMDHSFDATDSRFLTWSNNQIKVKVSNVTFGSLAKPLPMSSGLWKIKPAPGTAGSLGCNVDVDVPFSTRSKFDANNIEKRYIFASGFPEALTAPNFTGDGELEVYLDANIDMNNIASAQGISTATLTPIVEQILLQIEQFSGYDICFGGVRGPSNPPSQGGNIVIDFGPIPSTVNGNPVAFTIVGLEGIERCPNSSQVFSHWNSSRIIFNQGYNFHIGPVPNSGIPSGQYDLESVLYHEFGHAFLLDHSNDMMANGTLDTRTMYFELAPTQVKRTFDQETITGFSNIVNFSYNFLNANSGGSICATELLNPLWMDINVDNSVNCFTSKTKEFVAKQECLGVELNRGDASILVSAKLPVRIEVFHIDGRLIQKCTQKRHHTIPITFRSPIVIKAYNSECVFSQIYIP